MAFDEIARARSHGNLAVKMKINPKTANEVLHISAEALTKLLYHNDEVAHAARAGRPVPPLEDTEDLKGARSILSSLKHSSGKTFGANEERAEMRRRVFAYYHTFVASRFASRSVAA